MCKQVTLQKTQVYPFRTEINDFSTLSKHVSFFLNNLNLPLQDKEVFQSFAQAQVSVTNEIFDYLGHPKFLFCPTQYCTTRAVPTVRNSEYLQTLGSKLAPEIQVSCYRPVLYIQNEYGVYCHNVSYQNMFLSYFTGLRSENIPRIPKPRIIRDHCFDQITTYK